MVASILSNLISLNTVSCTQTSGCHQLPHLLISPVGLKVSDRCSKSDRGRNKNSRVEEVLRIDLPLLLWALAEFALSSCPLCTSSLFPSLRTALPALWGCNSKRRAPVYYTNKRSPSFSISIVSNSVWPLGPTGTRLESNPYFMESALLQNSLIPKQRCKEMAVGLWKLCALSFFNKGILWRVPFADLLQPSAE